jgi:NAD(P)-dependent dehydrogenase (short-subunit alcohol dehydrogenase family)
MKSRPRVVVTGASSGIGRATALRFAVDGFDVGVNSRREARLRQLVEAFPAGNHLVCAGDYADPEVANSIDSPIDQWRRPFDTMFEGGVRITRMVVPLMPQGGRVIHITSIHGGRAEANAGAYSMAKAALNQFCRVLAVELASRGILVNAIAPGFVDTEMSVRPDGVNELETDWFRQNYVEGHHLPLKRAGRPEEIAGVAAFLAGPDATYITGQVITVDGGLTITF